jgi:hypothetical protein
LVKKRAWRSGSGGSVLVGKVRLELSRFDYLAREVEGGAGILMTGESN